MFARDGARCKLPDAAGSAIKEGTDGAWKGHRRATVFDGNVQSYCIRKVGGWKGVSAGCVGVIS
jgi:hypothetical protein